MRRDNSASRSQRVSGIGSEAMEPARLGPVSFGARARRLHQLLLPGAGLYQLSHDSAARKTLRAVPDLG